MVACHGELRMLCLHYEIRKELLLRKLIAETYTIVIDTETKIHKPTIGRLLHLNEKLIIMVTNLFLLTPYWLPFFIKCGSSRLIDTELIHQRVFLRQLNAQCTWVNDSLAFVIHLIDRGSFVIERESNTQITIW